jgi:hypothetical protein
VRGGVSRSEAVFRGGGVGWQGLGGKYGPEGRSPDGQFSGGGWGVSGMAGQIHGYSVSAVAEALVPPVRPQLGCLVALFAPQKAHQAERQWQRAYEKWERLYYCTRCDGVYIPGETGLISVEQLSLLLYA